MGGGYRGGGNTFNRGGTQTGPRRDPNTMDVGSGAIWPKIVGKGTKGG